MRRVAGAEGTKEHLAGWPSFAVSKLSRWRLPHASWVSKRGNPCCRYQEIFFTRICALRAHSPVRVRVHCRQSTKPKRLAMTNEHEVGPVVPTFATSAKVRQPMCCHCHRKSRAGQPPNNIRKDCTTFDTYPKNPRRKISISILLDGAHWRSFCQRKCGSV
jgi:hypothetical protein